MVPIDSMAVANCEEMEAQLAQHVWYENIRVLIGFVRVAGLVTDRRGKSKLCYAIEPLLSDLDGQVISKLLRICLIISMMLCFDLAAFMTALRISMVTFCSFLFSMRILCSSHLRIATSCLLSWSSGSDLADGRFAWNSLLLLIGNSLCILQLFSSQLSILCVNKFPLKLNLLDGRLR